MSEKLYEGKAKILYPAERPDEVRVVFKDEATAFNAQKRAVFAEKGRLNCAISVHLLQTVAQAGVPTHLLRPDGPDAFIARRLEMIPAEVVVRNVAAGSLAQRLKLASGTHLRRPVVELFLKDDALGDPWINYTHLEALGRGTEEDVRASARLALRVNAVLEPYLGARGLVLVDFKLEFGRDRSGTLVLGDEISPDTCRLWDAATRTPLDKDRFRQDLGGLVDAYREVWRRLEG